MTVPRTTGRIRPLVPAAVGAVAAATVVNVLLALALRSALGVDPAFLALQLPPVAVATAVAGSAGVVLYLLLVRRMPARADRVFTVVAGVVAVLSLGAPLSLLAGGGAAFAGTSTAAALALVPLHLVPAAVLVGVVRRSRT